MNSEAAHSRLGASGAKRWMTCPASVALSENLPDLPTTSYAEEGLKAHELAECELRGLFFHEAYEPLSNVPDEFQSEMSSHVQIYVNTIMEIIDSCPVGSCIYLVEEKVHINWIHEELWGTVDCVVYDEENQHMHVFDLKYGEGIMVDAEENPQLLFYATGAFMKFMPETITSYIIQPRANSGPVMKKWTYGVERIKQFEDGLRWSLKDVELYRSMASGMSSIQSSDVNPGDHCQFCPAHTVCPKHLETFTNLVETQEHDIEAYDDAFMVRVVQAKKEMISWFNAIEEILLARLLQGEQIEDLKLVRTNKNRSWINEAKVLKKFGKRKMTVTKTLSPAQAEKLLGKEGVEKYIERLEGEPTLALLSDKRKAIQPPALETFDDTTLEGEYARGVNPEKLPSWGHSEKTFDDTTKD